MGRKEDELKQATTLLEDVKKKLSEVEENREHLSNCLLIVNNILSLEDDDLLRSKIYEVLESVDIMGDIDDDVFEEEVKVVSDSDVPTNIINETKDSNLLTLGSMSSTTSSGYLSTEDEREKINMHSHQQKPINERRHSVAIGNLNTPLSAVSQRYRRNSMVIKTTMEVEPNDENVKKKCFIESINLDGKNIKGNLHFKNATYKSEVTVDRRHSVQPISSLLSSKFSRRQSSYTPNSQRPARMNRDKEHLLPNSYDDYKISSFKGNPDTLPLERIISTTRVGYPRKAPSFIKEHSFQKSNFIVSKKCFPCGNRLKVGRSGYRCTDCLIICHLECMHNVPLPCHFDKAHQTGFMNNNEKYKNYFQSPPLYEVGE